LCVSNSILFRAGLTIKVLSDTFPHSVVFEIGDYVQFRYKQYSAESLRPFGGVVGKPGVSIEFKFPGVDEWRHTGWLVDSSGPDVKSWMEENYQIQGRITSKWAPYLSKPDGQEGEKWYYQGGVHWWVKEVHGEVEPDWLGRRTTTKTPDFLQEGLQK
jgi:hypothetical protein